MGKDSSPAKVAPSQSVRFLEKHAYSQPSAKQLLDGERPLQPTPGVRPLAWMFGVNPCRIRLLTQHCKGSTVAFCLLPALQAHGCAWHGDSTVACTPSDPLIGCDAAEAVAALWSSDWMSCAGMMLSLHQRGAVLCSASCI